MIIVKLFGLALIVFAGFLFTNLLRNQEKGYESLSWPITKGKILKAKVDVVDSDEGSYLYPKLIYEYVVDGTLYKSKKIFYGEDPISLDSHASLHIYSIGAIVDVYYNPQKPNEAVLHPGADKEYSIRRIIFIIILLVFGLSIILYHK